MFRNSLFLSYCRVGGEGRSIVLEIVERAAVDDLGAAQFFFDDLAHCNDATEASVGHVGNVAASHQSGADALCWALGHQRCGKIAAIGTHGVDIGLLVWRYRNQTTDLARARRALSLSLSLSLSLYPFFFLSPPENVLSFRDCFGRKTRPPKKKELGRMR